MRQRDIVAACERAATLPYAKSRPAKDRVSAAAACFSAFDKVGEPSRHSFVTCAMRLLLEAWSQQCAS